MIFSLFRARNRKSRRRATQEVYDDRYLSPERYEEVLERIFSLSGCVYIFLSHSSFHNTGVYIYVFRGVSAFKCALALGALKGCERAARRASSKYITERLHLNVLFFFGCLSPPTPFPPEKPNAVYVPGIRQVF